ncbi:MAG TPA: hypothetical protein VFL55_10445, partial [Acetobacteraceae bacterium]|nr:hypothetical protein [Acetobacteraceae bacterium]
MAVSLRIRCIVRHRDRLAQSGRRGAITADTNNNGRKSIMDPIRRDILLTGAAVAATAAAPRVL